MAPTPGLSRVSEHEALQSSADNRSHVLGIASMRVQLAAETTGIGVDHARGLLEHSGFDLVPQTANVVACVGLKLIRGTQQSENPCNSDGSGLGQAAFGGNLVCHAESIAILKPNAKFVQQAHSAAEILMLALARAIPSWSDHKARPASTHLNLKFHRIDRVRRDGGPQVHRHRDRGQAQVALMLAEDANAARCRNGKGVNILGHSAAPS